MLKKKYIIYNYFLICSLNYTPISDIWFYLYVTVATKGNMDAV